MPAGLRILLEMRPALDGHAGIPQETRLLFNELARLPGASVEGLIQSSGRMLAPGLFDDTASEDERIDRLSRVVVSLQGGSRSRLEQIEASLRLWRDQRLLAPLTLLGRRVRLGRFDAQRFADFVWRAMFERTLRHEDFDVVTACRFRVAVLPWTAMHRSALSTRWTGRAIYPRLDTGDFDVMVAETPYPGRVSPATTLVVRYHDAVPLLMPHTISDRAFHRASHFHALRRNVADGAWFACVSETTRRDLISIFPQAEPRAVTIHNMLSQHYFHEESSPDRLREIVRVRLSQSMPDNRPDLSRLPSDGSFEYLLMVSTIEPRKNHLTLLAAWEQLRAEGHPELKLVLVGTLGWEHKVIVRKLRPWLDRGDLYVLEDVPAAELRLLYRHAKATVCPSFGEGFDLSGVEAMRCGSPVAASDISVHREVFEDAAEYFSPYSAETLALGVARLIDPAAAPLREQGARRRAEVSARYLPERIMPQWRALFERLAVRKAA
ncbi:MAG: glycosyltransferase family 1 protein [Caldimonas sp.]